MKHALLCVWALAWSSAGPALAQKSSLQDAEFYPLVQQGVLTGCQIGFSVLRPDVEYGDGMPVLADGLILFSKKGTLGLRLGIAKGPDFDEFLAPDRAYLFGGYKSNVADFVEHFDSSDKGFRFFVFQLGDDTTNILVRLMDVESVEVLYAPNDATVDARFVVDFGSAPKPYGEFVDCMSALLN